METDKREQRRGKMRGEKEGLRKGFWGEALGLLILVVYLFSFRAFCGMGPCY